MRSLFRGRRRGARRSLLLVGLLMVAAFASLPSAAPALADTSKPIKLLISPGVDGHSNRCLQERYAGNYWVADCTLPNPPPWQRWSVILNSSTSIKLVSAHGTCVADDGTDLTPQTCNSATGSRQDWSLIYRAEGRVEIRNEYTNHCLHFNASTVAIKPLACQGTIPTASRWWFSPVSNTSTTYNQWRSVGKCAQLYFGEVVRNNCGDASMSVQMFNPAPSWLAGYVNSDGVNKWHPPVYTIVSQVSGEYCVSSNEFWPMPGQVLVSGKCGDVLKRQHFMIQALPGLTSFRLIGYFGNGHPDLDLPCVTMGTFDGINRPGYADCVGSVTDLSSIPANQRWEFVGLAP